MFAYTLFLHIPLNCWGLLLLASIIPFLLGLLLGWLLRSGLVKRIKELEEENKKNHDHWTAIEKDHVALKYEHEESLKELDRAKASLRNCEADSMVLRAKLEQAVHPMESSRGASIGFAKAAPGLNYSILFQQDNLQIIEGVGPKVEQVLKEAGISDWQKMAESTPESLAEILANAGSAYKMMNPTSWPQQGKLAFQNRWEELVELQKFLDAGREDQGDMDSPSKIEQMALKILGFSNNPEDLKIVEGIGPKIEELLKNAGISTWADLSASSVDRLKAILGEAGESFRLADPGTWPQQAALAAEGRWQELKDLQDRLSGGR
ncbi:MAG: hypothetical protein IPH16_11265 [Haliscomenobacter sp.]|nr:hypothetical protein [Haliscomenobacter sp.]MBK7474711.1 hypothetical protein [Haliscomenobacter sp.]